VVAWNALVVGLGVVAGTHLDWAKQMLMGYNAVAFGVVVAGLVAGGLLFFYRARARRSTSS
jgi:membrane protein DedA with SNARE-associated domain